MIGTRLRSSGTPKTNLASSNGGVPDVDPDARPPETPQSRRFRVYGMWRADQHDNLVLAAAVDRCYQEQPGLGVC